MHILYLNIIMYILYKKIKKYLHDQFHGDFVQKSYWTTTDSITSTFDDSALIWVFIPKRSIPTVTLSNVATPYHLIA